MRRRVFLATGVSVGLTGCTGGDAFQFGSSDPNSQDGDRTGDPADTESEDQQPEQDPDHELIAYDPYYGVDWGAVTHHKSTFHGHPRNELPNPADVVDFYRGAQAGSNGRTVGGEETEGGQPGETYTVYSVTGKGGNPMLFPWTEFSSIDTGWEDRNPEELGVVAFPASESESTEHVVSPFSLIMDDYIDADDRHGVIEEILTREEFHEPKGLAILVHPDRYVEGPEDWVRYAEDLETFSRQDGFIGTDVFSRTDPVGETLRPMWDNILTEYAPSRMFWGFGSDDASNYRVGIDGDVRWTTLLLDDDEFDPADQAGSREAAMEAFLEGRSFATARRPEWDEEAREAYPTAVPTIRKIVVDERGITLEASDYDEIRWISGGEVATTGPSIVLSDRHTPYVRAELELHSTGHHSVTCTQPWGLATADD